MWEKWAQNHNKTRTTLVTSVKKLYELLTCPGTEGTYLIFSKDSVVWVSWKHPVDNITARKSFDVAIAAYVTN